MLLGKRSLAAAAMGAAVVLAASGPGQAAGAEGAARPLAVAVFPTELYDTSGEPRTADVEARLGHATMRLRAQLEALPGYRVVSLVPVRERVAGLGHLYGCNGCELELAREVGAKAAVVTLVHKISTLIQHIQITVKDVASGRVTQKASASIRGDTEQAYRHGIDWLVEHRLAKRAAPVPR